MEKEKKLQHLAKIQWASIKKRGADSKENLQEKIKHSCNTER